MLSELGEGERTAALERYRAIRPCLDHNVSKAEIAHARGVAVRTVERWVERYLKHGLAGLARKTRRDKGARKLSTRLSQAVEGLALTKPRLSAATVHRKAVCAAERLGEPPPSYTQVYTLVRNLDTGLLTLAHEGANAYSDTFDLIHRREAEGSNAVWQADHSKLDFFVKDERGAPQKPWLTIVLDDYSRAVGGVNLSFRSPSAIRTSLALRQAIWRKMNPAWRVCGIPQVLYVDHGSDFTSRHIEQVAADLKIRLVFSIVARPRGRGKVERFFESLNQVLLSRLPGYAPAGNRPAAALTLAQLAAEIERYIIEEYNRTPHRSTGKAPQERWEAGGFLPQMPDSLEKLDLLLLTVPRARRVRPDGIHFMGMRYIDPTLAAYVREEVILRYDPEDIAEVRVFHQGRFLCRAVCQDLAGETVSFREIATARQRRKRELRQVLQDRRKIVDSLLESKRWQPDDPPPEPPQPDPAPPWPALKRYLTE